MSSYSLNDIIICFEKDMIFKKIDEILNDKKKGYICTINSNILVSAYLSNSYKSILQESSLNICDGSMVAKKLGKLNGVVLKPFPGPDFMMTVLKMRKYDFVFLGGNHVILDRLKKKIEMIDPKVSAMPFIELPYCTADEFDYKGIADEINKFRPDIIWLSLGAPKQEIFANKIQPYLDYGVVVSVGAAFPFHSGMIKRAPKWILNLGLEWFWRLLIEPKKTGARLFKELYYMPKMLNQERNRLKIK
jgi:N-acetylglucosaminyldiphosphoundecaprenol N-acetyl-beta-D-mannosaminyltransferase